MLVALIIPNYETVTGRIILLDASRLEACVGCVPDRTAAPDGHIQHKPTNRSAAALTSTVLNHTF